MLGIVYLILCVGLGYIICRLCFPNLRNFCKNTYGGTEVNLSPVLLFFPACFMFGTIVMTWITYGLACFFAAIKGNTYLFGMDNALGPANLILLPLAIVGIGLAILFMQRRKPDAFGCYVRNFSRGEMFFFGFVFLLFFALFFWTFFYRNGDYYVGYSVASDFAPHIGMIRSFSVGSNFPTSYSHFAGEDIKYHFMFQFLVGNLNYLGMRLDLAFNLPSLICMMNVFFLLYFYTVKIFGRRTVGGIACALFAFRSSYAFLDFAAGIPKKTGFLKGIIQNSDFIGTTSHEDWGLFNLNVYCNQRHLAMGISVLLFVLIYFTQYLFRGTARCRANADAKMLQFLTDNPEESLVAGEKAEYLIRESVFTADGWLRRKDITSSMCKALACGILLGLCGFFNGACVIACLSVLFLMAFVSDQRLEFALTAAVAVLLTALSAKLFITGSAVEPKYFFGFLAENGTLFGAMKYLITLCGILPLMVLISLVLIKRTEKYLVFCFSAPVIVTFTLSLTTDISVNHKYLMIGVMLLCIPVAYLLDRVFRYPGSYAKVLASFLLICLTVTGIYEMTVVFKRNDATVGNSMKLNENSDVCNFVMTQATAEDIFLTDWYSLNEFVLGGAMLYYGWPYYAWSAGYDTFGREKNAYAMYEAESPEQLDSLVKACNIRFIVVDYGVRTREEFQVNEENIRNTYEAVYNDGDTVIYDTRKRMQR